MNRRQLHTASPAGVLRVCPVVLLVSIGPKTTGVVVPAGAVGAGGCPLVVAGSTSRGLLVVAVRAGCRLFSCGSCNYAGWSMNMRVQSYVVSYDCHYSATVNCFEAGI